MKRGLFILTFAICAGLLIWACDDDPVSPPEAEHFSLGVTLTDTLGNPVEGLRVSAWNHLSGMVAVKAADAPSPVTGIAGKSLVAAAASPQEVGDINCNGVAEEIADLIMYVQFFTRGLGVFGDHVEESIAASDMNGDGNVLTLADMVYLSRKVTGDAAPVPPTDTAYAYLVYDSTTGSLSVSGPEMGAALVTVRGEALGGSETMASDWYFDGTYSRTCLYGLEEGQSFSGWFLRVDSELVDVELATYDGNPVLVVIQALEVAFEQNYPNPFNGSTTIQFALPINCRCEILIADSYNDEVANYDGTAEAGVHTLDWAAMDRPNGVYTCHLTARNTVNNEVLIADSQYMVIWSANTEANALGYTSASGTFVTTDSLAFPNLQDWPDFVRTNESGDLMGTFGFSDTITIVLTDTLSGAYQSFERVVGGGSNEFEFTWDPAR